MGLRATLPNHIPACRSEFLNNRGSKINVVILIVIMVKVIYYQISWLTVTQGKKSGCQSLKRLALSFDIFAP